MHDEVRKLFHSGSAKTPAAETELKRELPRIHTGYGCRLIALSGQTGSDGLVHGIEMLSPLLAGLENDERLAVEISLVIDPDHPAVSLRGTAIGISNGSATDRASHCGRLLQALARGQFPGFVMRPLTLEETSLSPLPVSTTIRPQGRMSSVARRTTTPCPTLVTTSDPGVILPSMRFTAEGMLAAAELLNTRGEPSSLSLEMRLVRFDAWALRQLSGAREAALDGEGARTNIEALRHLAESIPDDALMSALLNDRGGVELTLVVRTTTALDEATRRMLCHAMFGVEPTDGTATTALDLSTTYPRNFALDRAIGGLTAAALKSISRKPETYQPPLQKGLLLGKTGDGRPVILTDADRAMHELIIGAIGTGKSTLFLNQMAGDMADGKGLVLLDPHGDLWDAARRLVPAHRQKDLVLAHLGDPAFGFTMNMLSGYGGVPAVERSATVNGLIRLFKNSLWAGVPEAFGPMFELYFRNALMLVMEVEGDGATILDCQRLFQDDDYRNDLIARCKTQVVVDFWRKTCDRVSYNDISLENIAPYIICKFAPFTSNALLEPILGSRSSSLNMQQAIRDGKIVLVNLAKGIVGADSSRLVGALMTMRLVAAAQTQMALPEASRMPFVAYLDEFQTYATEHLAEGIEETRKYKLRLVLACQSLGQLDGRSNRPDIGQSIVANIANLIAFRLGVDDAATLARWFEPGFKAEDLMYLPNHVAVGRLLAAGRALRPIEFLTLPPPQPVAIL